MTLGGKQHGQGLVGEAVHLAEFGVPFLLAEPPIHRLQKRAAVGNIGSRQGIGQGQVRNLKGFLAGIGQNDGIVFRAQKGRGVGIHVGKEVGLLVLRDHHVGWKVVPRPQLLGDDRTQAGKLQGRIGPVAGQGVVGALRVVVLLGVHGADNSQLVHVAGDPGKELRDLNAVGPGGNGIEWAMGLGVPGIDLGGSTLQPQQYAGLGFFSRTGASRGGRFQGQVLPQAQTQQAESADSEEFPAGPAAAKLIDRQVHKRIPQ